MPGLCHLALINLCNKKTKQKASDDKHVIVMVLFDMLSGIPRL